MQVVLALLEIILVSYKVLGKTDDAVAIYKDIKAKYPKTEIGLNVDKFIFKLKVQP